MGKSNPPYTQSKIEPKKLQEAVQKFFASKPSASGKDSVDPPAAKHRKSVPKNVEHTAG